MLYCIRATSHSCDFFIACSCAISIRSTLENVLDILTLDVLQWKQNERSRCSRVVSRRIECRRFILHESFDKLRRLFQSSWRSWFVVTAMNSRELEIIDACRWRREQDRMIEATWVNFLLYWNSSLFETLQARIRSLDVCCKLFELFDLLFVQILSCRSASRSVSRRIDFSFRSYADDVARSVVELLDC